MARRLTPSRDAAGASRFLAAAAAHVAAGRFAEAARAYAEAERADPSDFRAPLSLASLDLRAGRPDLAAPRLKLAVALRPDLFEAQHNLGAAAQAIEAWEDAAAAYAAALALKPGAVETRRNLGIVLVILGRPEEAAAHYRVLAAEPATRFWALTRLALLDPAAVDDAELADMRRAADAENANPDEAIGLLFAAGGALERRGRDDEAFAAFAEGNRRQRATFAASPATDPARLVKAHAAAARSVIQSFDADVLRQRAGAGLATSAPIFIVGMPRSGSSLIEQILSAHPDVRSLGETAALPRLLETGAAPSPALARRYLEAARARGWKGAGRFVDKTLENYLHVGAIALMFPNAVILHAVRGPLDTCLSCYRQLFASGSETLYDLAEIGAEYVAYRQVMDHWRAVLPGRLVDVDHEALVADPEARIRWLVTDACGLAWNDACRAFHQAGGAVRTASSAQVRRPIFTSSIARWRRYEAHLGPLPAALGRYAPSR